MALRALAISDIHSHVQELQQLLGKAGKFDFCLLAGDLTNYGSMRDAAQVIKVLPENTVAVPGNLDTPEVLKAMEEAGISVHNASKEIKGIRIAGFGGGFPGTPGQMNFPDEMLWNSLSSLGIGSSTVLLTHLPPFKSRLDRAFAGVRIGSKSVRKAIEEFKPLLSVSGHAHESFGKETIGETLCLNPGAVKDGRAALIEIPSKKIEFITL